MRSEETLEAGSLQRAEIRAALERLEREARDVEDEEARQWLAAVLSRWKRPPEAWNDGK